MGASWQAARDVGGLHVVYCLVHYPTMDLTLSPSEQSFRDELRAWLADNHPGDEPAGEDDAFDHRRRWQRSSMTPDTPASPGPRSTAGAAPLLVEQAVFGEEMARVRAPSPANVLGLVMGAPCDAPRHRRAEGRWLQPILTGDEIWCQGFSEPESGSDLARSNQGGQVERRVGRDRAEGLDHLRPQGQVVHARGALDQDAPKHQGLTYFIMDMEQESAGPPAPPDHESAEFNELFIEEARIPDENVVGGVKQWLGSGDHHADERARWPRSGVGRRVRIARSRRSRTSPRARSGRRPHPPADRAARHRGGAAAAKRLARPHAHHEARRARPRGSLPKWQWSDINQALTELAVDILGEDGAAWDSPWTYRVLRSRANSIEGGTTEILKNIIAERVLSLEAEWRA